MLKRLYLDNCFTHHDKTFTFEKGLTGIIGPNESGKSLIVEMIRYALFGSKALRGKSEDYKKLHVELDFVVGNDQYTVIRKGVKVHLSGPTHEVTGTKPVDEAIREILGYDLHVFDVANACNQGNIEALSEMTPANRKAMVDRTVGLNTLDHLIKVCGSEGNTLKREYEAMERAIIEPVAPVEPEGYVASNLLDEARVDAENRQSEYNQLEGYLSRAPRAPVAPEECAVEETSEELQKAQDNRRAIERSIQNVKANLRGIEPEQWSEVDLDVVEQDHDNYDRWKQKERLLAQGHICCPECEHEWPVADLGDLADVEPVDPPALSRREIATHRARVGNEEQMAKLEQQINALELELEATPDRAADLTARETWEAQDQAYQKQLVAWETYNEGLAEKQARFEELEGAQEVLSAVQAQLAVSLQYERDLVRFRSDQVTYESQLEVAASLRDRSAEYLKARDIIQALKVSVKSHLLPSLNKVASALLSQMTGGERYLVEVDEEFDITVDGQRINTLSGSGKAVANLSIRIALGQILTNRVFSVFMADEVDAAMDDERAAYTAEALRRLTNHVGQVILVTHKRPETDHTFELKT